MLFELIHLKGIVLPIALINEIRKPVHRGTIRYTQLSNLIIVVVS
jgi:hypothetical protein